MTTKPTKVSEQLENCFVEQWTDEHEEGHIGYKASLRLRILDLIQTQIRQGQIEVLTELFRYTIEVAGADVERTGNGKYNAVTTDSIHQLIAELKGETV